MAVPSNGQDAIGANLSRLVVEPKSVIRPVVKVVDASPIRRVASECLTAKALHRAEWFHFHAGNADALARCHEVQCNLADHHAFAVATDARPDAQFATTQPDQLMRF
ncbi:MAG: hypothetical protein IPP03_22595 [Dechloromonas sp.]|nr:hypothetical protein [Candidatus Dechloromonas phosphoritropha]